MEKIIKIEDVFKTQEEIDSWYNDLIKGIKMGIGSIIQDVGVNSFIDNYSSLYASSIAGFNNMKRDYYNRVLHKTPESYITLDKILEKLLK